MASAPLIPSYPVLYQWGENAVAAMNNWTSICWSIYFILPNDEFFMRALVEVDRRLEQIESLVIAQWIDFWRASGSTKFSFIIQNSIPRKIQYTVL